MDEECEKNEWSRNGMQKERWEREKKERKINQREKIKWYVEEREMKLRCQGRVFNENQGCNDH